MTTSIIHLAVGLVLLVAVNIVLGSLNALFDGSFDKVKLRNGIIKGIIVAACFIAFYMAGYLNPDIIAIEVDGQTVNLMTASNLALLTAYVLYAKDVFVKLKNLILSKTSGTPPEGLSWRGGRMEFSKKMLVLHICISVLLCITTIVGTLTDHDVTAIAALTGTSFVTDGAWGGFYYWKSKNENRAKYAQRFLNKFADKYGADAALRATEIVLKD